MQWASSQSPCALSFQFSSTDLTHSIFPFSLVESCSYSICFWPARLQLQSSPVKNADRRRSIQAGPPQQNGHPSTPPLMGDSSGPFQQPPLVIPKTRSARPWTARTYRPAGKTAHGIHCSPSPSTIPCTPTSRVSRTSLLTTLPTNAVPSGGWLSTSWMQQARSMLPRHWSGPPSVTSASRSRELDTTSTRGMY